MSNIDKIVKQTTKQIQAIILVYIYFILAACSAIDRQATKFEPIYDKDEYSYYQYTSFAALQYPLESEDAEQIRIGWLEA